jgi:hypothetical protein
MVTNKDLERKVASEQQQNQRHRQELAETEHEVQKMKNDCQDLE